MTAPSEAQLLDYFIFDAEVDVGHFSRAKTDEVAAHFKIDPQITYRALNALARKGVLTKTRDVMRRHKGKTAVGYQWWEYTWRPGDLERYEQRHGLEEARRQETAMKLTPMEQKVLLAIATSEYQYGTGDYLIGNYVYSKSVVDDAGISRRSAAGVFSSLSKKGLVTTSFHDEDTVALTAAGVQAVQTLQASPPTRLEAPMTRRTRRAAPEPTTAERAEAAGEQYANDQINGEHFMNWVHDQLVEASRMDPSTVLPLETKADARKIAHNMLQQLEWDTKRDLDGRDLEHLIGDEATRENTKAFFEGFRKALDASHDWLADELLTINQELRGGGVEEDRRRGPRGGAVRRLTRSTAPPGTPVRVVDGDSMYRGEVGTVVEPDARRMAKLDDFNRRFLKGEGTVLVERRNGSLFVIHARALEREPANPIDTRRHSMNEIHAYNIEVFFRDTSGRGEHLARKFQGQIESVIQLPLVAQGALLDGYRLEYGPIHRDDYLELERLIYGKVGNAGRVHLVQVMYGGLSRPEPARRSGAREVHRTSRRR